MQPALTADNTINPTQDVQALCGLVLSVIQKKADYDALLDFLEPVATRSVNMAPDAAERLMLLFNEVEQHAALNNQLHQIISTETAPTLVLSEAGVVLAQNESATAMFAIQEGDPHTRLGLSAQDFEQFQQRIYRHQGPTLLSTRPQSLLRHGSALGEGPPLVLTATYHAQHRVFLLQSLDCRWPTSVDAALQEVFGLTGSERDILASLAQGMSAEDISTQRCRSLGTVRQQIKSLMQKLEASRQSQVIALGAALANRTTSQLPRHSAAGRFSSSPLELGDFIRGHRRVGWRRYGDPHGHPVLLLHGPFFGAGDFEQDRDLARERGLNVWVPERPGYGRTLPAAHGVDPLDNQVDDALALMDQQGLTRVHLLSHESGLIPALGLATRHPDRFSGLLSVSPSGHFGKDADLSGVPRQQRMLLWAAAHSPWMLRMMIRLVMVQARKLGPERWVSGVFADAPHELAVLYTDSSRQGTLGTYSYNFSQHGAGLELDVQQTTTSWHLMFQTLQQPFLGLMGVHNGTTPPTFVRNLLTVRPDLELEELPDAGQTLSISHAPLVFDRLMDMIRQSEKGIPH